MDSINEEINALKQAKAHLGDGDMGKALELYNTILSNNDTCSEALAARGAIHYQNAHIDLAIKDLSFAHEILSTDLDITFNLAIAHLKARQYEKAQGLFLHCANRDPKPADAWRHLGIAHHHQGDLQSSIDAYSQAINTTSTETSFPEAHLGRALAHLSLGNYNDGWRDFQWRKQLDNFVMPALSTSQWDGSIQANKTLFIYAEQGQGDTLQFLRYAIALHQQGMSVICAVQTELISLLKAASPLPPDCIIDSSSLGSPPPHDFHVAMLSLPALMCDTPNKLSHYPTPYLKQETLNKPLKAHIAQYPGFKVGISWAGNPRHPQDALRSTQLTQWKDLLSCAGVSVLSLQVGHSSDDLKHIPPAIRPVDLSAHITDFFDTASAIAALDLVITVDTAIAHLAASMGKPTWVLIGDFPDWRWARQGSDTPWYPSMRLYRKSIKQDWQAVFKSLNSDLQQTLIKPTSTQRIEALEKRAQEAIEKQQWPEAKAHTMRLLRSRPNHQALWFHLGVINYQLNHVDHAILAFKNFLKLSPNNAEAHNNLGLLHQRINDSDSAIWYFQQAISHKPNFHDARFNLAKYLQNSGRHNDSIKHCQVILDTQPNYLEARNTLGLCHMETRQHQQALEAFSAVLKQDPKHINAMINTGLTLEHQRKLPQAEACYQKALTLDPHNESALHHLGSLALPPLNHGKLHKALTYFQHILTNNPTHEAAQYAVAEVLKLQGKLTQSITAIKTLVDQNPQYQDAQHQYLSSLSYSAMHKAEVVAQAHFDWAKSITQKTPAQIIPARPKKQLRVGFVSADFRQHPIATFFTPLLSHLSSDTITPYCYSHTLHADAATDQLKQHCPNWRNVQKLNNNALSQVIKADNIDILIDLGGHTGHNRLSVFAQKPAPLQMTWLGYPNTTGLDTIDYRITDRYCDPDDNSPHYSERFAHLKHFFTFDSSLSDTMSPLPALENNVFTFGSLHSSIRLTEDMLNLWANILLESQNTRLLICRNTLRGKLADDIRQIFTDKGIDSSRLDIRHQWPENNHLALYKEIDLSLDTTPWSGHTTACESLSMGVPILSIAGDHHAGRMVASTLNAIGLTDFIANDQHGYIAKACYFANNHSPLIDLRKNLHTTLKKSRLCDAKAFSDDFQRLLWQAWNDNIEW